MSTGRRAALAMVALLLPLVAAQAKDDFHKTAASSITAHMKGTEEGSPFRKALSDKMKERKAARKKVPSNVVYHEPTLEEDAHGIGWGKGDCEEKGRCETPGYVVRYKVRTELHYSGPDEVYDPEPGKPIRKWPELRIRKHVKDAEGKWVATDPPEYEDYTQQYKDAVAAAAAAQGRVAWKDEEHPEGEYEFGLEPLEEEVTEEITFTFKEGQEELAKAFFNRLFAAVEAGDATAESAILMGFTYAGPNIDYTVGGTKRFCIFGWCLTLYDIRAGFALDWGLGLRLPAWSRLEGPTSLVAGQEYTFWSTIDAREALGDWSSEQYEAVGASGEDGNEFVMRIEMFAGAKVIILGLNVCPWCQYVEVDEDYGQSFGTPFGPGTSFPLPVMTIPVKDFDFGIVSLAVGLQVTPTLGSRTVSAWSEGLKLDHAAGQPLAYPVRGCIDGENPAHVQSIDVEQYQYWFNSFALSLGAYLQLDVGGYGAWNPTFTFLTLDLSGMLGSTGLYLGDHVQCDFAFNCVAAPVDQRVKVMADVVDQSAPSTALDLAGTPGANDWWTSDVTAALGATDNPPGCGIGVAGTDYAVGPAALAPGASFALAEEGTVTVYWRSTDRDGNVEGTLSRVVKIDKTPPTITGAPTTAANARAWYRADVTVHFDASDATSGIASLTPDTVLSAEASGQSVTGEAVDQAGLASTFTVDGINIDKTAPIIAIAAPLATGYENTDVITLGWTLDDPLSGLLGHGATLDGLPATAATSTAIVSGATIELIELGGGQHELLVTATDNADNVRTAAVTFLVDVDIDGLLAAVSYGYGKGWLSSGAVRSLTAKAVVAKRALASGQEHAARGVLVAFETELSALRGKGVLEPAFGILSADVQYVLGRYGLLDTM